MIINNENLRSIRVAFSAAFNKVYLETNTHLDKIATTIPSTTKMNTYGWMGDFPVMREWIGEREIANLNEKAYNITNKHFESTVSVDRDDVEDDNLGLYTARIQMMAQEAKTHPGILASQTLKKGFSEKCYDDKPFFSEEHKVGKNTFSNRGKAKFTMESYAAARAAMRLLKKENGDPISINPALLIVPPNLEAEARKILEAELIDGTTNPWKGSAELLVDENISGGDYPDNWFLVDNTKPLKPIIYQERKPIKFVSKVSEQDDNVFMNNKFLYGADGRYNAGYGFWQMAYGSTGEQAG